MHCTVLIPAYNTGAYIGDAILSVFQQTWDDWDILIVDDGSDDSTVDVVNSWMSSYDKNVSLVTSDHAGVTAATALGLEMARGPVVTVLDSDDKLFPRSLEIGVREFKKNPKLGFLWTKFVRSNGSMGWSGPLPTGKTLFQALVRGKWWQASHQRFIKLSTYQKSRKLNPTIKRASDLQLAVVMADTGCRVKFVPKVTYWYRQNRKGSISSNRRMQKRDAEIIISRARKWKK